MSLDLLGLLKDQITISDNFFIMHTLLSYLLGVFHMNFILKWMESK